MFWLEKSVSWNFSYLCQASHPASASDNTYLFDDEAFCDEFDFLNNLTDNEDSLASEGTRSVYCHHIFFIIINLGNSDRFG